VATNGHTSFNATPSFLTIPAGKNVQCFNANPNVTTVAAGAGVSLVNIGGNFGTFLGNSYYQAVNINPVISSARYAVGVNVSMDSVTVYPGVNASVAIQDLTFQTVQPDATSNSYTIEFTTGATAGSEVVTLSIPSITIQIESGVSTAAQIKAACEANPTFNSNITTAISGVGSNAQVAAGPANFANGENPGTKRAAYFDGDVEITGGLSFQGSLSIERLNAIGSLELVDTGGNPQSVHL
jgi:hypothetical protein